LTIFIGFNGKNMTFDLFISFGIGLVEFLKKIIIILWFFQSFFETLSINGVKKCQFLDGISFQKSTKSVL
jgi:hypothetical protein